MKALHNIRNYRHSFIFAYYFPQTLNNFGFCTSSDPPTSHGKKEKPLFFDERVQDLLQKLTGKDMNRIFRRYREGKPFKPPVYKFMTTEQLEKAIKEAESRAPEKLQMPPVLPPREEITEVIAKDDCLKKYTNSKFVFTDITFGKSDRTRVIVVRDPDGTLRHANWEERVRMNEIYFPKPGRKLQVPEMFKEEYLKPLLEKGEFEFVLNRACIQYEPDDPEYIRITSMTYEAINQASAFPQLRSTRHYGSLMFYLASTSNLKNILIENLETDRLEDASCIILLYNILHPENKCHYDYSEGNELSFIQAFVQQLAPNDTELAMTMKKYMDFLNSRMSKAAK